MIASDMYDLIKRDLGEALVNNNRVTDARLLAAINADYVLRSAELQCFTRSHTLASVLDQVEYALPGDICDLRGVRYHTGTVPLTRTTAKVLEAKNPAYRNAAHDTPTHYYLSDVRKIALYPKPAVGAQDILLDAYTVPYNPLPAGGVGVLTGADAPLWPAQFHELIVHDVVYLFASRFRNQGEEMQARAIAAKADADRIAAEFLAYVRT
ncbi:MAG: phage adaptor protein [Armatimonadota bacterium]